MSGPALVSILVPCFNAEAWLDATLASASAQTWPNLEIIVVDDGSTDGSLAAARRWESRGRVRVLAQPNRGASAARNAALAASRGEWIQFLDADDLLAPDKIARQLDPAPDPHCAQGARWGRFVDDPAQTRFAEEILCRDADPVSWIVDKLEHHAMMHPAAWLISRTLADRAGPWDERLTLDDDGEYFCRVVLSSAGVRHHPAAASYYRSRISSSLSRRRSAAALASGLRAVELTADRLIAREDSPRTRHAAAAALTRCYQESYPDGGDSGRRALARARALGGARVEPLGGPRFQQLRRIVGWRLARRLQRLFFR
ncbi:MAG TPA: glycosyltransferase family A protein [Opitutaceae bacterium]|jgi:glycosyltransferase involved in cell wall biosynthesis